MESRLADGLPDPGSEREKKFEEGIIKQKAIFVHYFIAHGAINV